MRNRLLRARFGFAPWHVRSHAVARPYKAQVARVVSELAPTAVVEIGCGLGDILGNVSAPVRVGLDSDSGAVRAASTLHPDCTFHSASFEDAAEVLSALGVEGIDALILVNWTHDLPPTELTEGLMKLAAAHDINWLVMDIITSPDPGYRFRHDRWLQRLSRDPVARERLDNVRDLVVVRLDALDF
jgi:hypothetical protein